MKVSDLKTYTKAEIRALSASVLSKLVIKARDYYEKGKPVISDARFDAVEEILRKKDPKNVALTQVGAAVKSTGRKKVKLPHPMYSLAKIKPENANTLDKWIGKFPGPYVVSDKMDGLSIQIAYRKGKPFSAHTRGDGTTGQDVSHLLPVLKIPKRVSKDMVIRAEIAMSEAKFEKHAASEYANARNLVAGLTNRLNSDASMLKHADVLAYEIIEPRVKPSAAFKTLAAEGFTTPPHVTVRAGKMDTAVLSKLLTAARKKSPHAIDGIVIESDTVNKRPPAGTHSPSYAFAFKMQTEDDAETVTIKSITWEESKHGKLIPVINIPPTKLSGATVVNVSGHNAYFIANGFRFKDRNLGMKKQPLGKGAVIKVLRSGDVIPHVVAVVKGVAKPDMPAVPYTWNSTGVDIVMDVKTDLVRDKRITSFFSTLGVDGIKLGVVQQLTAAGYTSIIKILRADADDFAQIPGFQRRKAEKLAASIAEKTRSVELPTLMDGSGYFGMGFGTKRSALIVNAYPNLLVAWAAYTPSQITAKVMKLEGFQEKTASQFGANFAKFLKWLKTSKIKPALPKKIKAVGAKLKGEAVCFTGFRDKELELEIKKQGGTIVSGVSSKTTILIYAAGKGSSKLDKADALGIKSYTADEFKRRYKI